MGPVFKRIAMNYPPILFHPINSITAYKGQIIYDTPRHRGQGTDSGVVPAVAARARGHPAGDPAGRDLGDMMLRRLRYGRCRRGSRRLRPVRCPARSAAADAQCRRCRRPQGAAAVTGRSAASQGLRMVPRTRRSARCRVAGGLLSSAG